MWDDQFAAFAEHFRVIRYDTRGFGRTRTEPATFSNRQDIVDLLRHLGVERAHLIGVSRVGDRSPSTSRSSTLKWSAR